MPDRSYEGTDPLDPRHTVWSLLRRVRRRWLTSVLARGTARAALAAAAVVAVTVAIDWAGGPVGPMLLTLGAVAVLGALLGAGWMLWPLRQRPSDRRVARFIEEHRPDLEDRLVSAIEQCESSEPAGPFQQLVVADAARRAPEIDPATIVRVETLRAALLQAAGAIAVLALVLFVARGPAGRAVQALWLYAFPSSVALEVTPGDTRVPAGEPLRVEARLMESPGSSGGAIPVLTIDDGVETRRVDMRASGESFEFEFASVSANFTYRVSAGNVESAVYRVEALHAPTVERIDVHYEYPAFTGLESRVEEDGGDIYAPAGTKARVVVHLDKPVDTGRLTMADGDDVVLTGGARMLEAALDITGDGAYRVALVDHDGLSSPGDTEYFIRIMNDRPPEVRILRPGGDRQITSLEEVVIEARADDDYGIDRFELVYSIRGEAERSAALGGRRGATTVNGGHTLYVEDMDVEPGDFITYYARARDVSRAKRSSEARSDIFFLDVKPFEEEFVAAQSQSMGGGGGGGSLEDLVAAQKAIIVATWKLEQRATAGRSAQDIGAVARAQGELRERTQAAASEMGGGRRRRSSSQGADAGAVTSPLEAAVVAMGRSQASLAELRTAEAIPSEMEALNHLLKAQAEIRRRQVARQQAQGGGGGGSGAQQDLSALFDRELQRQQETNYETPNRGGGSEQEAESEDLQKVRELARRQDELARRQRDMARERGALSDEEIKRRLERLTRDQMELRREAEELARELDRQRQERQASASEAGQESGQQQSQQGQQQAQQGGGSGGQGTASGGRSDADPMREALEEMRRATSELRRQDPSEASERADGALSGLRRLEQQLAGGQPDQQRREFGELQLESQQVAEAQRRIAREGERLDPAEPNGDSMRRLAGEKEQLADRVDALADRLETLGRNQGATDAPARQAASELVREAVSRQMRESAAELRGAERTGREGADAGAGREGTGSDTRTSAEGEAADAGLDPARMAEDDERLAQTLDRIARQMGASGDSAQAETLELSDRLEQLGRMRERLDALEAELARGGETGPPSAEGDAPGSGTEPGGETRSGDRRQAPLDDVEQEYRRQLQQTMQLLAQMQDGDGQGGSGRRTPEDQRASPSAPGTEAFKQDYASWDELRRDVSLSLERLEASLSRQLEAQASEDRLNAGADQDMPEDYRALVSKYYQALAAKKP